MASIRKTPEGKFQARVVIKGKVKARNFDTHREAKAWGEDAPSAQRRGAFIDPQSKTTLGEWAAAWRATTVHLKPKTQTSYDDLLRNLVLPTFGSVRLTTIQPMDVSAWVAELTTRVSASRARQGFGILSMILKSAVANNLIPSNPCDHVKAPRATKREADFLTARQVEVLADSIDPHYRTMIFVLAYGGLRWGECAALRRGKVDILRRRVEVSESVLSETGGMTYGTPKSHAIRTVVIPRFVADLMGRHLEDVPNDPRALVFVTQKGNALRHSNFRRSVWLPAIAAAGLPTSVTPHDLRHTTAALLIRQGGHAKAIQKMLGHSSISVTFDVYGHLFDDDLDDLADRMDAARELLLDSYGIVANSEGHRLRR